MNRLASGAIFIWGKVGEIAPPHLVMPLTVEPSKPRLCNDNRVLNLWIKDTPLKLNSLTALPHYVFPNSYQSVCDDKSGYYSLLKAAHSSVFNGLVGTTIPFSWKTGIHLSFNRSPFFTLFSISLFHVCAGCWFAWSEDGVITRAIRRHELSSGSRLQILLYFFLCRD